MELQYILNKLIVRGKNRKVEMQISCSIRSRMPPCTRRNGPRRCWRESGGRTRGSGTRCGCSMETKGGGGGEGGGGEEGVNSVSKRVEEGYSWNTQGEERRNNGSQDNMHMKGRYWKEHQHIRL